MTEIKRLIRSSLGLVVLILFNCTEPVDFSQGEDIELLPVVETSLVFFEAPAPEFINQGDANFSIRDFVEISFFNDEFVQDNLIKAEFVFEVQNSINRDFRLDITFADAEGTPLEVLIVEVPASPDNVNRITNVVQTYEAEALERIKQAQILDFELSLLRGMPIAEDALGRINVKSSGIFSLMIDNK